MPETRKQISDWPWAPIILFSLLPGWDVFAKAVALVDERLHVPQIIWLRDGQLAIYPVVTTLPGYHLLMASLARITGVETLTGLRLVSMVVALLLPLVFYRLARRLVPDEAAARTALLFFLPIVYPFVFLVYTDLLALTLVLLALALTLERRWLWAGWVATLAIGVRQTSVVWLAFLFVYGGLEAGAGVDWRRWVRHAGRAWSFVLGGAVFVAFVLWNGGVAMGDRGMHSATQLRLENLVFAPMLLVILLWPLLAAGLRRVGPRLRSRPWLLLLPAVLGGVLLFAFRIDHPYNEVQGYLHNRFLDLVTGGLGGRMVGLAMLLVGLAGLIGARLERPAAYALYPFWALSLLPLWMVEPRYQIVPVALWLALHGPFSRPRLILAVIWAGALTMALMTLIRTGKYFL